MRRATVNDNAGGVWSQRVGETFDVVGPGANPMHTVLAAGRREITLPTRWLDVRDDFKPRALRAREGMLR